MKLRRFLSIVVLAWSAGLYLLTGCAPELDFLIDDFVAPKAEISGTSTAPTLLFSSDEGQATVVFHCNRRWSAAFVNDRASQWCSLPETEGRGGTVSVVVRVSQNMDYDERSASIVFTCDDVTRTLVVTQKQKDALLLESNRLEVPYVGGTYELHFRTNVDYKVSVADDAASWISHSGTKGLTSHSAILQIQANNTLKARQGEVVVSSSMGKEVVKVYQEGEKPTLVLGEHDFDLEAAEADIFFRVSSNLDVSYSLHDGSWIQEVKTRTVSTNEFHFRVDRNQGRKERTDYIVFRDKEYGVSDSVRIHQRVVPILADDQVVPRTLPSRSIKLSLLTSGGDPLVYKVSSSASWLQFEEIVEDPESGHCLIRFETKPNPDKTPREGTIRIYHVDYQMPEEITLTQVEAQRFFTYTTRRTEVKAPSISHDGSGFLLWGDGTFEDLSSVCGTPDWTHVYTDGRKQHTVVVESAAIPWLLVPEPEDGMHFDFSNLKKED